MISLETHETHLHSLPFRIYPWASRASSPMDPSAIQLPGRFMSLYLARSGQEGTPLTRKAVPKAEIELPGRMSVPQGSWAGRCRRGAAREGFERGKQTAPPSHVAALRLSVSIIMDTGLSPLAAMRAAPALHPAFAAVQTDFAVLMRSISNPKPPQP